MYRILLFLTFFSVLQWKPAPIPKKVLLVYDQTFSNQIPHIDRIQAIQKLAKENNFILDTIRINAKFSEKYLKKYAALIFINPINEHLNYQQRNQLERYLQAGGGLLQISLPPASDSDWPWYTRLQEAGLKAQYVKSFQVADKDQLKYWRTAFDGGLYSQITLTNNSQSFPDSNWFEFLPDELDFVTNHPPLNYQKATLQEIP
ncbi:ThuA domain-containing protein [Adhaeribacter pallidiroseus]|uniref:ThuA-like domain-containing protein n=1 Tax=Adhaeribacter pallidiroseus TaxID=2072847 RepID=A0A369QJ67_9BACT|nr:ThuA domain-containing protein [Adhaeribacter pallidiroseus]RDC64951.1 hypothetical protein AHMF7616_03573 [Adhaeribacter pallidiroseus]